VSIRARWQAYNNLSPIVDTYNYHFKKLGVYRYTQYTTPDENDATCQNSTTDVCFADNQCNYTTGTLYNPFASEADENGSGISIYNGNIQVTSWCLTPTNHLTPYPTPTICGGRYMFTTNISSISPACGGTVEEGMLAVYNSKGQYGESENFPLRCNDNICIFGVGSRTIRDECQGCKDGNHIDYYVIDGRCTNINDLGNYITIKIFN